MLKPLIPLIRKLLARLIAREASGAMGVSAPVTGRALGKMRQELIDSTGGALDIEEATIVQTPDGSSVRAQVRAQRRTENLTAVRKEARENVRTENIDPQPLDPDWESRFDDYARDVSPSDLQKIWARILSGELEKPGRTSLRTLSILRNLSSGDAHAFVGLMQYRIGDFIVHDCIEEIDAPRLTARLLDAGLLHPTISVGPRIETDDTGENTPGQHGNLCLVIKGPPRTKLQFLTDASMSLTIAGKELASLCPANENWEYLSRVARMLMEKQYGLFAAPGIRDPDGTLKYSVDKLKRIDPVT